MARNFYLDNEDLRFQMEHLDWETLFPVVELDKTDPDAPRNLEEAKVVYEEFLRTIGEYVAEKMAPRVHELDEQHPILENGEMRDAKTMSDFIAGLKDLGAMALSFPRHVGGYNLPWLVANAACEIIARADVSVMTYYGFFTGLGLAYQFYAFEEGNFKAKGTKLISTIYDKQMREISSGQTCGAMCLTEPQAGSDLAQIRTKAEKAKDGSFRLNGQKIWITCGHGEHHMVLARSEKESTHPGLKGLSLFYVPAHIEKDGKRVRNFEIGGQEKKMGQHSSVTVTLNYTDTYAELIGQRGHGFRNTLLLMNDARLLVGYEGIGLCEAAYRLAKNYADERETMGKKISQHEMISDYLDDMSVTLKGLRALAFDAGFHEEYANRLKVLLKLEPPQDEQEKRTIEKTIQKHKWKARMATPLVKYTASENAVRYARLAMQIMGGVGYMREYGAEKLMRDALILPIYEGTSQIQSLMALKDHLTHAMRNPAQFISGMAKAKIDNLRAKTPEDAALARIKTIYFSSIQTMMTRMVADKFGDLKGKPLTEWRASFLKNWDPKNDFSFGLLHAERFCQIASVVAMAKVLVKQAQKISDASVRSQRIALAMSFMERYEPKLRGLLLEIEASRGSLVKQFFKSKESVKKQKAVANGVGASEEVNA